MPLDFTHPFPPFVSCLLPWACSARRRIRLPIGQQLAGSVQPFEHEHRIVRAFLHQRQQRPMIGDRWGDELMEIARARLPHDHASFHVD
jgi:hypothetical protein